MQLSSANRDGNTVMTEEVGGSEGGYWFFKGLPLMRVFPPGNVRAVETLVGIEADPLILRIGVPLDDPRVFPVRRARLGVIKALDRGINADMLLKQEFFWYRIIYNFLSASPTYLAKIHLGKFEEFSSGNF
jgi:hypothetical protein